MQLFKTDCREAKEIESFILDGFSPRYGESPARLESRPEWARLRELGTELWLDTGDPDEIGDLWSCDFTALTTNNTLLNKEIQKGAYDRLIPRAAALLDRQGASMPEQVQLELAFILNARHALTLVEKFDAFVSVEEHTALADQVEAAVVFGERFHAICPERFYVKIPLTPAGILATRKLSRKNIPVNHTLGFSARQNYLATRIGTPEFVNVFLGRLNGFVADNQLGDGSLVGERATVASQQVVRRLREQHGLQTRQIGASLRSPAQVCNLAGIDVLTLPAGVADSFLETAIPSERLTDRMEEAYQPGLAQGTDEQETGLSTLWELTEDFVQAVEELAGQDLDKFTPGDLIDFMASRGFADLFPRWTQEHVHASAAEGKIPNFQTWKKMLATKKIGLDALINMAGLNSFSTDQASMDRRIMSVLT